jgi:hypothetical protein
MRSKLFIFRDVQKTGQKILAHSFSLLLIIQIPEPAPAHNPNSSSFLRLPDSSPPANVLSQGAGKNLSQSACVLPPL